jgi:hypothetical protein
MNKNNAPLKKNHVSKRLEVGTFSPTFEKVEVAILKYGSPIYFVKFSVRRKEAHMRLLAHSPRLGGVEGVCEQHLRE